ncbi:hypothetical protein CCP2SC5_1010005 [Azospirillaceae bacterium]
MSDIDTIEKRIPVCVERDGVIYANSRDIAVYFKKTHKDVLEAIDNLLKSLMAENSAMRALFVLVEFETPMTPGRKFRSFDMTKDAFVLLAMGFTGEKALKFKLAYIERFNAMEAVLRDQAVRGDVLVRSLMSDLAEIVTQQIVAVQNLASEVAELRTARDPRIAVQDRLTTYDVAETLGIPKKGRGAKITQIRKSLMKFAAARDVVVVYRHDTQRNEEAFPTSMVAEWQKLVWNVSEVERKAKERSSATGQGVLDFSARRREIRDVQTGSSL